MAHLRQMRSAAAPERLIALAFAIVPERVLHSIRGQAQWPVVSRFGVGVGGFLCVELPMKQVWARTWFGEVFDDCSVVRPLRSTPRCASVIRVFRDRCDSFGRAPYAVRVAKHVHL